MVVLSGVLVIASLLVIPIALAGAYRWLADKTIFFPEFALPMLLLAGIVVIFGAIAVLVNACKSVDLMR